jgi:N-acetyl-anhydromuramyl-L-alanine amidase AmpD
MMIARDLLPTNKPLKKKEQIVIHCMGEYIIDGAHWSARDYLKHIGLSAHYLICPSGLAIQCVSDDFVAYHCKGYNHKSLGLEFLVPGIHDYTSFLKAIKKPYLSHAQCVTGYKVIQDWCKKYSLTKDNIFRHSDLDPQRKKDPGIGFSFDQLEKAYRSKNENM